MTGSGIALGVISTVQILDDLGRGLLTLLLVHRFLLLDLVGLGLRLALGFMQLTGDALAVLDHYEFSVVWMVCHIA